MSRRFLATTRSPDSPHETSPRPAGHRVCLSILELEDAGRILRRPGRRLALLTSEPAPPKDGSPAWAASTGTQARDSCRGLHP